MSNQWKLVPVEPTDDMLIIGQEAIFHHPRGALEDCEESARAYRDMLAAAPEKPIDTEALRGLVYQLESTRRARVFSVLAGSSKDYLEELDRQITALKAVLS